MEPSAEPMTLEQDMQEIVAALPAPIRNYLAQRQYSAVAKKFMGKYSLHIDQAAILEREIMLLLMGLETPDEFADSLAKEVGLGSDAVRSLMADVNQEIFVPLQNEMRAAVAAPKPAKSPVPPASQPRPAVASVPNYAPPSAPGSHFRLQNKLAPAAPVQAQTAQPSSLAQAIQSAMRSPAPASQPAPAPASPKQEAAPVLPQAPAAAPAAQPLQNLQRPPAARVAPLPPKIAMPGARSLAAHPLELPVGEEETLPAKPVAERPSAPPPENLPGALPPQAPVQKSAPTQPFAPPAPYTVDPYREPID